MCFYSIRVHLCVLGEVGDAHQQQRKALTGDGPAFAATVLLVAAVFAFVAADGPQTTAFAAVTAHRRRRIGPHVYAPPLPKKQDQGRHRRSQ